MTQVHQHQRSEEGCYPCDLIQRLARADAEIERLRAVIREAYHVTADHPFAPFTDQPSVCAHIRGTSDGTPRYGARVYCTLPREMHKATATRWAVSA